MTSFWLRLIDFAKPLYRWQNVDIDQLRAIVGIKLEMDNRRAPVFRMQQQRTKEHSSSFGLTLFIYSLFGAFLSFVIVTIPSIVFSFSIYHAYLMVMITMTLISDFSAILLDTSDNTIILPRPVSAKTFYAARATHILLYISQISLGLSLVPIIVTFFMYGPLVGAVLILTSILSVIFSVSITNGLYLLMMRFTSEERLKSIINYFQIAMAIIMMGGYQILPRLLRFSDTAEMSGDTMQWWSVLIPPMWMAGLVKMVHDLSFDPIYIASTLLALVVPLASWKLINTYLTPYFTTKLTDLGTSSTPVQQSASGSSRKSSGFQLGNWVTRAGLERATFTLVSFAFSRDRKLKLRIYPAIGSFVVIIALILFRQSKNDVSISEYIQSLGQTEGHLFLIYACIFILVAVAFEIHYSDEYKASWIYQSAPIRNPGEILSGTLKAILVRFFIPLYAFAAAVILFIWGGRVVNDLLLGMLACILLMLTIFILIYKHVPLSLEPTARNQGSSFVRTIFSMLMIGALGAGHYFLTKLDLLVWLACPVLVVVCCAVLMAYKNVTWEDIEI